MLMAILISELKAINKNDKFMTSFITRQPRQSQKEETLGCASFAHIQRAAENPDKALQEIHWSPVNMTTGHFDQFLVMNSILIRK